MIKSKILSTFVFVAFFLACGPTESKINAPAPRNDDGCGPGKVGLNCDGEAEQFSEFKGPLSPEQKKLVSDMLVSLVRTTKAFGQATDTGIVRSESDDPMVKTMAQILKKTCELTNISPNPGEKNPKSIKRAKGSGCAVDLDLVVSTFNEKENILDVNTDWKYSVLSSDFKALNDVDTIDLKIRQNTQTSDNRRSTSNVKLKRSGNLKSQLSGVVNVIGSGSLRISDTDGKHDVKGDFRTQLQFKDKDFVFDLRENVGYVNGKLVKKFYLNGVEISEEEVDNLIGDSPLFARSY